MPEEKRLVAIMFTDIVGYSSLMGEDEERAYQLVKKNRQIQKPIIEKHGGIWLKEMGDGVLASFPNVSEAVYCAKEIQEVCEKDQDLKLRIGIHEGEVIFEDEDIFGDGVNIASRLESLAPVGGIYISESVFRNIENKKGIKANFVKEKALKNVKHPVKIYEVKVESSVKYTEPQEKKKNRNKLLYILFGALSIIIAAILMWQYLLKQSTSPAINKEKSIAVMPFDNESDDKQNEYFVNGMMEDIRNNLSIIGDLRIISKTSTEKYRETSLSTTEIAKELGVNYLLEGTVQKQGNQVKIHAQLIDAEIDDHIWTKTYLRDISEVFKVQSEIAQIIVKELYSTVTPEELKVIETIPTKSLTAYDFFLRARDEHTTYWLGYKNGDVLENAITLYYRALEYDSAFAQAYTGLALAYIDKHYWQSYLEEDFLDSALILSNIALSYDNQLEEAYYIRGRYYSEAKGEYNKALNDFDRAIQINPNYSWAYIQRAYIYSNNLDNWLEGLKNMHKAASLEHGFPLLEILNGLVYRYLNIGFTDKAIHYQKEILKLKNDSLRYFGLLRNIEANNGNFEAALKLTMKMYDYDSTNYSVKVNLIYLNTCLGKYKEAFNAMSLIKSKETHYEIQNRLGYVYWQLGKREEAKYYFAKQIEYCLESINLNRPIAVESKIAYYDLAGVYAFLGEKEKAYQHLDVFDKKSFYPLWLITFVKYDPLFNSIRKEDRFQKILQNIEAKFLREHNRVKAWLEEEGML